MHRIGIAVAACLIASCQTTSPVEAVAEQQALAPVHEVPIYVTAVCGDCHAVTANAVSPNPEAPGFEDIANSPGLTRETLIAFLSDAHNYPMQMDVDLDQSDIEDIADHMMTLQSDAYHRTPS